MIISLSSVKVSLKICDGMLQKEKTKKQYIVSFNS